MDVKFLLLLFSLLNGLVANIAQSVIQSEAVLGPDTPLKVTVEMGQTKYWRFKCNGYPSDAVISLSSYSENADPLLFLSLDPDAPPRLLPTVATSVHQWREDVPGHHYVIAQAVGPRGGIIGLMNTKRLGEEDLVGALSMRCSTIVAFDPIFFDHLRASDVCPVGSTSDGRIAADEGKVFWTDGQLCSGHGRCGKHGLCECGGNYAGPACEHKHQDVLVTNATFSVDVPAGHYQYFRVRIPPGFPGGYLKVDVHSQAPVVVLLRRGEPPTKTSFDISNFDRWVNQKSSSSLTVQVAAESGSAPAFVGFGHLPVCPNLVTDPSTECYKDDATRQCKDSCHRCTKCVPTRREGEFGSFGRRVCEDECDTCRSDHCVTKLRACSPRLSCRSPFAQSCEMHCSACMACLDSNDPFCETDACDCCSSCFPAAAKCGFLQPEPLTPEDFIYLAVFNHPRFPSVHYLRAHGHSEVKLSSGVVTFPSVHYLPVVVQFDLQADPEFAETGATPRNWFAELNDPFHNIQDWTSFAQEAYPEGQRSIYDLTLDSGLGEVPVATTVRLFRDRVTLLHVKDAVEGDVVEVQFTDGPNITHVLASSRAAPKTFFDFDEVFVLPGMEVRFSAVGTRSLWVAIFGATDSSIKVQARVMEGRVSLEAGIEKVGETLAIVGAVMLAVLCGAAVLVSAKLGAAGVGERTGIDVSVPVTERFVSLLNSQRAAGSMTSVMQSCAFPGAPTEFDNVAQEDRYLRRGGFGDDGI